MQHRVDSASAIARSSAPRSRISTAVQVDFLPGELAQSLEDRRLRVREVIDDAHAMPRCYERDAGVRADIAESAGDERSSAGPDSRVKRWEVGRRFAHQLVEGVDDEIRVLVAVDLIIGAHDALELEQQAPRPGVLTQYASSPPEGGSPAP